MREYQVWVLDLDLDEVVDVDAEDRYQAEDIVRDRYPDATSVEVLNGYEFDDEE